MSKWLFVDRKAVQDFDGFWTDYSWYVKDGHHVFVFGDHELYRPEDEDWDWECDSWVEASDWFECYHGISEDDLVITEYTKEVLDDMLSWMNIR